MKRNIIGTLIFLVCLFLAFNTSAQNVTGRPVWIVGHAANSFRSLENCLNDVGMCGVEIDIWTDEEHKTADWSVNHGDPFNGERYIPELERNEKNKEIDKKNPQDGWKDYWVALDEYLTWMDRTPQLNLIWLDVKTPQYLSSLIDYVHHYLDKFYVDKDIKVPFSIVYGLYDLDHINKEVVNKLRDYEGFNIAREGQLSGTYATKPLSIIDVIRRTKWGLKRGQHFMTNGIAHNFWYFNSNIAQSLREAKELRNNNAFCARTGVWTLGKPHHGLQMICSKNDCPKQSYETECDLVLMECRSNFKPMVLWGGTPFALRSFGIQFFEPGVGGKKSWCDLYNKGNYHKAGDRFTDPFYFKTTD